MSLVDDPRAETAKQRSLRVPLDCAYKSPRAARWKHWLAIAAALAAVLYCVWVAMTASGAKQLNPAPVAGVHSAWEHDCHQCHIPGVPLRGDADGTLAISQFLASNVNANPHHTSDQKCITCHQGPAHHSLQIEKEVESCAACHSDHQGRSADLTRVDDRLCTSCHTEIARHRTKIDTPTTGEAQHTVENVTAFAAGQHPEFASPGRSDPGHIKFSHARHLLPGQKEVQALNRKKLSELDPTLSAALRATYKDDGQGFVQLECANCHQLEAAANATATPTSGAYMQPIVFEQHCRACHDLPVPHGLEGTSLRAALAGAKLATSPKTLSPQTPVERNIPGQPLHAISSELNHDPATHLLQSKCDQCHELTSKQGPNTASLAAGVDVLLPNIPTVWFKNSRFDHAAHRTLKCDECHDAQAAAPGVAPPLDHARVLLPKLEKCASCHAPGNARSDCAECHRYHAMNEAPHGVGAAIRGVASRTTSDIFLPSATPSPSPP